MTRKKQPTKKTPTRKKVATKKKATTRRTAGRPTKTVYKKEYCDQIKEHMAEGLSFVTFASKIGISRSTLYEWVKKYPEFKEAKEQASLHNRIFWERLGIGIATGTMRGNAAVWIFNMINRFPDDFKNNRDKEVTDNKVEIKLKYDASSNKKDE